MTPSLTSDLQAVWLVRSRILSSDLGFWMILIGYDTRRKRFTNRPYTVYAVLFFSLWIFLVLTLLASFGGQFLKALPFVSPGAAAVGAAVFGLLVLFLVELFQAARRSPFRFSEEDALLLCAAPLDRRPVGLLWLLEAWARQGLGVWPVAVVIAYALVEALALRPLTPADLPMYLLAGARMFSVAAPLSLAVKALAWSLGAWRLRGQRETANLRWVSPVLGLVLVAGWFIAGGDLLLRFLLPLDFPFQAGLGMANWLAGVTVALLMAVAGMAVLWWASTQMSLARAAQERHNRQALEVALFSGQAGLAQEAVQQRYMRGTQLPSRLLLGNGPVAGMWKSILQERRSFQIGNLFAWLSLCGLTLMFLAISNGGSTIWSVLVWLILGEQQMVRPLRRELGSWWLFRQWPFSSSTSLVVLLAFPLLQIWLAGLVGAGLAHLLGGQVTRLDIWLLAASPPGVGLAGAWHVLRQSKTQDLLAGRVPDVGLLGILMGLLVVLINGGVAWILLGNQSVPAGVAFPLVGVGNLAVLFGLWRMAGANLRTLK